MGAPIHSSSLIAEHEDTCTIHKLGLSISESNGMYRDNVDDTMNSLDDGEVYGYKFNPRDHLSAFEQSVIWV